MRKHIVLFLLCVSCLGSISAQTFFSKIIPSKDLSPKTTNDTLRILAVLVDFQEDKASSTFGNGKFGTIFSKNYGQNILDPLPHDKAYFSLHLDFARNYFKKVSNGKLNVTYDIIPSVVTVSKTMPNYSPANNSEDYSLLGNLAKEVWTLVSTQNPGINFSNYDLFTIFHAGVGRDVSLPGSLGTERDLPSLYMGDKTLRNILKSDLTGLPQNRAGQLNTMFIPETESREMSDVTGAVNLLQISINGLIVANIGSHLGLPDLYDTKTGLSAIGRFGLMDGQAIFTYGGTFPPEPSPWEKIYLGWISATEIQPSAEFSSPGKILSLVANRVASAADTTVIKVPISSTEYYLVENRSRDALKNGAVVTYNSGNQSFNKTFEKDTTGFYSYSVDSLKGVITDVDEFDWALPGSGIVIWHIDENVINSKISVNQVNTDKFNRGVDVEEADGVQDIGEKFTTVFGDEIIGEGTSEDFWYKSNPAKLYKNRNYFDPSTIPPARSNSGANSPFGLYDFSDISNKMSFRLANYELTASLTAQRKLNLGDTLTSFTGSGSSGKTVFYAVAKNTLYKIDKNGNLLDSVNNFSYKKPLVINMGNADYVFGITGNNLNTYVSDGVSAPFKGVLNTGISLTSAPVAKLNSSNQYEVLVGTSKGSVLYYTPGNLPNAGPSFLKQDVFDTVYSIKQIVAESSYYQAIASSRVGNSDIIFDSQNKSYPFTETIRQAALTKDRNGKYLTVALLSSNVFNVVSVPDGKLIRNITAVSPENVSMFALGDLKRNGENYIIYSGGKFIQAVNIQGASAENFPFEDPKGIGFEQMPLIIGGQRSTEQTFVYAFSKDGRIFEISGDNGSVTAGFPISVGNNVTAAPLLLSDNNLVSLALVTSNNYYSLWNTKLTYKTPYWVGYLGNNLNTAFVGQALAVNAISDFFPKERAYNWPNPVYGSETNIRYYVSEDSKINIKIFDLAGGFVAELNSLAAGGSDNETVWNVSGIQSGVYLARIEATGVSGKKENSIIKIAIVK